jgi:type II secretory pathway pseudopilin PulG
MEELSFLWLPLSAWQTLAAGFEAAFTALGVVVSIFGVLASTVIAAIAVWVSRQATRVSEESMRIAQRASELEEQRGKTADSNSRRYERRQFYEAAMAWIMEVESDLIRGRVQPPRYLDRFAEIIDSETAPLLSGWLGHAQELVARHGAPGAPEKKLAFMEMKETFADAGATWVRVHKFNLAPFTPPI